MDSHRLAQFIASAITANCDAYHAKRITHDAWSAEQHRLWKMADENLVASAVRRMVCPSLAPPPYTVQKQLRERTLAVGRKR